MKLEILEDSKNYACQVIKLPNKLMVKGLDNLVEVNVQGNSCLISKDADEHSLYLFFPVESVLSHEFLSNNNLYRHNDLNLDKAKKGFFEDNKRVKALKFKGVISSGFVIGIEALSYLGLDVSNFECGQEFNLINGQPICHKYLKKKRNLRTHEENKKQKLIDEMVDLKLAPEHFDTEHLLKYVDKMSLDDTIFVTYKLHGTSARYFNTLVKRKLSVFERIAKCLGIKVQTEEYAQICASRRVYKSVGFERLSNKNDFYSSGDIWTMVGKEYFEGKLFQGEAVYCEIVGKSYSGESIQHNYTYGFNKPMVYVYRISNINPQGIEIDLPYEHMKKRAEQLGVNVCPEFFKGTLRDFIGYCLTNTCISNELKNSVVDESTKTEYLTEIFYNHLLEKPSILDNSVVEEGFCIRRDFYPRPNIFKIKSKQFLLHESNMNNDEAVQNIEDEQAEVVNAG